MLTQVLKRWKRWSCAIFLFLFFFVFFRIAFLTISFASSTTSSRQGNSLQLVRTTSEIQAQTSQPEITQAKEEVEMVLNRLPVEQLAFAIQDVQVTQPEGQLQVRQGKIARMNGPIWEIFDLASVSVAPMTVNMPPITKAFGDPQPGYFVQFEGVLCADGVWYATTFCYNGDGSCSLAPEEFGWRSPTC